MEVYPAGLSADGEKQAHDQSSGGGRVCVRVCVWGGFFSPCILHTAYFVFHFLNCMHIIIYIYQQLELEYVFYFPCLVSHMNAKTNNLI